MSVLNSPQPTAPGGLSRGFERIKRSLFATAGICALVVCAGGALAQPIRVMVNGERVHFQDIGPQQVNGRVLVPVRGVLEQMGARVSWRPESQTVVASNDSVEIELTIGDRHARVNGRDTLLDVPAQTYADRTVVPLRFLSEALGARVRWDDANRTVFIMTGDGSDRPRGDRPRGDRPRGDRPRTDNPSRNDNPPPADQNNDRRRP